MVLYLFRNNKYLWYIKYAYTHILYTYNVFNCHILSSCLRHLDVIVNVPEGSEPWNYFREKYLAPKIILIPLYHTIISTDSILTPYVISRKYFNNTNRKCHLLNRWRCTVLVNACYEASWPALHWLFPYGTIL